MGSLADLPVLLGLAVALALYARALRELRRRGRRVPALQQAVWYAGLTLVGAALSSPIDGLSEDLLSAHMAQHLLLAELGAPLLLIGIRAPVLLFLLPRPALASLARRRRLRAAFRFLSRPPVAIPLYIVVLYLWHFAFLFEGALRSELVHALQHESFVAISVLVWWSVLQPNRLRVPGELWKVGHVFAARMGGMFLGMAFLVMRSPAYVGFYGARAREHGLAPLEDQQIAGGMMLTLDILIVCVALCFFFWRASEDDRRAEQAEREAAEQARAQQRVVAAP